MWNPYLIVLNTKEALFVLSARQMFIPAQQTSSLRYSCSWDKVADELHRVLFTQPSGPRADSEEPTPEPLQIQILIIWFKFVFRLCSLNTTSKQGKSNFSWIKKHIKIASNVFSGSNIPSQRLLVWTYGTKWKHSVWDAPSFRSRFRWDWTWPHKTFGSSYLRLNFWNKQKSGECGENSFWHSVQKIHWGICNVVSHQLYGLL